MEDGTLTWIRKRKVTKSGLGLQATQTGSTYIVQWGVMYLMTKRMSNALSNCTVSLRSKRSSISKLISKQLIQA
jgi:hypothetical protein